MINLPGLPTNFANLCPTTQNPPDAITLELPRSNDSGPTTRGDRGIHPPESLS